MEEALGNEFVLFLAGLGGLGLLEQPSAAQASLSGGLELAHVLTVAFHLFLFGIDTASKETSAGGNGFFIHCRRRRRLANQQGWMRHHKCLLVTERTTTISV